MADNAKPRNLRIGGVLLAAGSGSRMGHRPKGLLELDGVPLIRRALAALQQAGLQEVVVVLGEFAAQLEAALGTSAVRVLINPQPQDGQVSSQRLGLAALGSGIDAVIVALADQALINAQDIAELTNAYEDRPKDTQVVVPTVGGLPGNPVMFSALVKNAVLAAGPDFGCKQWQGDHRDAVYRWHTANTHYRWDVDTPEDIEQLALLTGHRLRWPAQ